MKNILFILPILFFPLSNYGQIYPNLISNNKVTTVGYWSVGQSARYHVSSSSKSLKANTDKILKEESYNYDIELKVVDSTANSYDFELRYINFESKKSSLEFSDKLSKLQLESVIRYRTDELGAFDTILNLTELNTELNEKLDLIVDLMVNDTELEEQKEIFQLVINTFKKNFEEIENVEALYLTDIIPIHGYYGIEMTLAKPIDLILEFPTIGDLVITGTGNITLNSINKVKDECGFSVNGKPDKNELKSYLSSFAMLFMLDGAKKISLDDVSINLNQKTKMKMELSTGWMILVEDTSKLTLKDGKKEFKKITMKEYQKI